MKTNLVGEASFALSWISELEDGIKSNEGYYEFYMRRNNRYFFRRGDSNRLIISTPESENELRTLKYGQVIKMSFKITEEQL